MGCGEFSSRLPLEPGQPGEVVSKIGQANLRAGAHHANGADQEPEPAFLDGKDMLAARPHRGTGSIAAGNVVRHFLAPGFLALELWPEAATLEQGEAVITEPGQAAGGKKSGAHLADFPRLRVWGQQVVEGGMEQPAGCVLVCAIVSKVITLAVSTFGKTPI